MSKRDFYEILEVNKNASEDMVVKLLPVLDDFERAIKAFDATVDAGIERRYHPDI